VASIGTPVTGLPNPIPSGITTATGTTAAEARTGLTPTSGRASMTSLAGVTLPTLPPGLDVINVVATPVADRKGPGAGLGPLGLLTAGLAAVHARRGPVFA